MTEYNHYFDRLIRGENGGDSTIHGRLHQIPDDPMAAAGNVIKLLRYASDTACESMSMIRDIFRWHGGDEIRSLLRPSDLELLREVCQFVGPEDEPSEEHVD